MPVFLKAIRPMIRRTSLSATGLLILAGCANSLEQHPVFNAYPIASPATNAVLSASDEAFSFEQAVNRVLTSNRRIAELKAAVEVAREFRRSATDIRDPEFQAEIRSRQQTGNTSADSWDDSRLGANFFLPNPWLVVPRVDSKKAGYLAAEADLSAARWTMICDVRRLFLEISYLTNDLSLAEEGARLNSTILKAVQSRSEQGGATAFDVATAGQRYLRSGDDLDQARHRCKLAQRELAALLNLPPERLRIATGTPPVPQLPPSGIEFEWADNKARHSRAEVAALHWRVMAADSACREARNVRMPWIKEVKAGRLDESDAWWAGIVMDVPIFSWTKNHSGDVALAQKSLAEANEATGIQQVSQEVRNAVDELNESRRQQDRYDSEVAPLLATMRQTLSTLQRTPNAMPDQLAAAGLQVVETMRLDLAARWRYRLALVNLEQVLGEPLRRSSSQSGVDGAALR